MIAGNLHPCEGSFHSNRRGLAWPGPACPKAAKGSKKRVYVKLAPPFPSNRGGTHRTLLIDPIDLDKTAPGAGTNNPGNVHVPQEGVQPPPSYVTPVGSSS